MKLASFTVNNYRSITSANKIAFSDITILVGKNNEGKSNLLRAINISMTALKYHQDVYGYRRIRSLFDWSADYPVSLQKSTNIPKHLALLSSLTASAQSLGIVISNLRHLDAVTKYL